MRTRLVLLCCCAAGLIGLSQSAAVTIYRIGGDSFPEPDADALGAPADSVQFLPLPWDQTHEAPFGSSHLVEIQPDSIRPQFVSGDVNLIPTVIDAGGTIKAWESYSGFLHEPEMAVMWDGDVETYYHGRYPFIGGQAAPYCGDAFFVEGAIWEFEGRCKYIWVTLPGAFPLRSVRVFPPPGTEEARFIPTYTLGLNDGDPLKIGFREREIRHMQANRSFDSPISIDFDVFFEVLDNKSGVLEFELEGEPAQNIVFIAEMGDWWIAEFEAYAEGFAVSSNYTSEVIDLEEPATLGPLTWSGELHPGATVDLMVRSGDTPDPNIYYRNTFRGVERSRYDAEGNPLGRAAYLRMEDGEQGGIAPDLETWTPWKPLAFGDQAAEFGTTRPRRYVQARADFSSGGRLDYIQFQATRPRVVTHAVAEIEPALVTAREATRFTFLLRPDISVGDLGFDRIRIVTPTRVDSVESVTIAGVPLEPSQWQATLDSTSFVVHIPPRDDRDTRDEIEIVFHSRVFDYGTVFDGWISDSSRPWEVGQRLEPGDAADFPAESNSLTVELVEVGSDVLDEIELSTEVFTPNADGVNDRLDIGFDLVNLSAAVPGEAGGVRSGRDSPGRDTAGAARQWPPFGVLGRQGRSPEAPGARSLRVATRCGDG